MFEFECPACNGCLIGRVLKIGPVLFQRALEVVKIQLAQDPQVASDRKIVRVLDQCVLIDGLGCIEASGFAVQQSQFIVGNRVADVDPQRLAEAMFRQLGFAGATVSNAEIDVRCSQSLLRCGQCLEQGDALFILLLLQICQCFGEQALGAVSHRKLLLSGTAR